MAILWVAEVRERKGRRSNSSILQGVRAGSEGREGRIGSESREGIGWQLEQ